METVIVKVTDRDIEEGTTYECDSCPIALALQRKLGYAVKVAVDLHRVLVKNQNTYWYCTTTSREYNQFIQAFDLGEDLPDTRTFVLEFEPSLDCPCQSLRHWVD